MEQIRHFNQPTKRQFQLYSDFISVIINNFKLNEFESEMLLQSITDTISSELDLIELSVKTKNYQSIKKACHRSRTAFKVLSLSHLDKLALDIITKVHETEKVDIEMIELFQDRLAIVKSILTKPKSKLSV